MSNLLLKSVRALVVAWSCLPLCGFAAILVSFDQTDYFAAAGDTIQVQVRIDGLSDLAAPSLSTFDLTIAYDPVDSQSDRCRVGRPSVGEPARSGRVRIAGQFHQSATLVDRTELTLVRCAGHSKHPTERRVQT